jgi:hypothetical protein
MGSMSDNVTTRLQSHSGETASSLNQTETLERLFPLDISKDCTILTYLKVTMK